MKKYYEAYDKRYKQVHNKGLVWSTNNNTKIVEDIIVKYNLKDTNLLEIGCGEGRDARYLLNINYNVLATDISKEAIKYCINQDQKHKNNYKVLDVTKDKLDNTFGFIFSVACLHMLVLKEDRNKFYQFIYNHLNENGYSLILTMGDGIKECESDISKAFNNIKRTHQESNKELNVATTSCKIVNFDTLFKELKNNNFEIIEYGITQIDNHFDKIMYVLIKKH
ncbi:MAG: class I SAM-dependent methyltransferase [Bacilli bacterium]|nr:class I SAM-dependent methyltransferase [Bacilli bacterium]